MDDDVALVDPNAGKKMYYTFDDSDGHYNGAVWTNQPPANATTVAPTKPYTDEQGNTIADITLDLQNPTWDQTKQQWVEQPSIKTPTAEQQAITALAQEIASYQEQIKSLEESVTALATGE